MIETGIIDGIIENKDFMTHGDAANTLHPGLAPAFGEHEFVTREQLLKLGVRDDSLIQSFGMKDFIPVSIVESNVRGFAIITDWYSDSLSFPHSLITPPVGIDYLYIMEPQYRDANGYSGSFHFVLDRPVYDVFVCNEAGRILGNSTTTGNRISFVAWLDDTNRNRFVLDMSSHGSTDIYLLIVLDGNTPSKSNTVVLVFHCNPQGSVNLDFEPNGKQKV